MMIELGKANKKHRVWLIECNRHVRTISSEIQKEVMIDMRENVIFLHTHFRALTTEINDC